MQFPYRSARDREPSQPRPRFPLDFVRCALRKVDHFRVLAALRRWLDNIALQDIGYRPTTNPEIKIGQSSLHPCVTPAGILLRHAKNQVRGPTHNSGRPALRRWMKFNFCATIGVIVSGETIVSKSSNALRPTA